MVKFLELFIDISALLNFYPQQMDVQTGIVLKKKENSTLHGEITYF